MRRISIVRFVAASAFALSAFIAAQAFARPALTDVTFRGSVTCSQCLDLSQHKGFTRWSWAMYKVSQGDNIVFVASGKTYGLKGDRQQLSKYIEDKVTVSGHLDGNTIEVTKITRPSKEE
jgi:hypothetical protein